MFFLHFKVYDVLKWKIFLIGFLDELGNFKQNNFIFQNVDFLHFTATDPIVLLQPNFASEHRFSQDLKFSKNYL